MDTYDQYWRNKYDALALMDLEDWQKSYWWDYRDTVNQRKFLLKQITGYPPHKTMVADIGCGPGVICRLLDSLGYGVVGLDFSLNTVKKAVETNDGHRAVYFQGDASRLSLKNSSLDIALALGIFQMASDVSQEIEEIHRILKPGGMVVISTPVQYRIWELPFFPLYCLMNCDGYPAHHNFKLQMVKQRETVPPRPSDPQSDVIKRHPVRVLRKLLSAGGFENIKVRYPGKMTRLPYLVNSVMAHICAIKKCQ